jgi:A/G-specific adenine glycosylase
MTYPAAPAPPSPLATALIAWFAAAARDLPWRRPGTSAWAVLVSEVMLQQTPVARVLPAYLAWLQRWPTPSDLAAASAGEAVRMWGKLGYPGRALRLHACAQAIAADHHGDVPESLPDLLALPGVGDYTARAVLAFAYGQRAPVVDTNVRRVLARAVAGLGQAGPPSPGRDLAAMGAVLPQHPPDAARFCAATMELGAVVCRASSPSCPSCPIVDRCAWRAAGYPAYDGPVARPQRFAGTDRQLRGLMLDVLRAAEGPVPAAALDLQWPDAAQRDRARDSLVADGLIDPLPDGRFALPS